MGEGVGGGQESSLLDGRILATPVLHALRDLDAEELEPLFQGA